MLANVFYNNKIDNFCDLLNLTSDGGDACWLMVVGMRRLSEKINCHS